MVNLYGGIWNLKTLYNQIFRVILLNHLKTLITYLQVLRKGKASKLTYPMLPHYLTMLNIMNGHYKRLKNINFSCLMVLGRKISMILFWFGLFLCKNWTHTVAPPFNFGINNSSPPPPLHTHTHTHTPILHVAQSYTWCHIIFWYHEILNPGSK